MKSRANNSDRENEKKKAYETNHVVEALELPKDIFGGLPLISMEGNRSLSITNHRGIVRYEHEKIVVATRHGSIEVTGRDLVIPQFTGDVIEIRGYVEGVTFL